MAKPNFERQIEIPSDYFFEISQKEYSNWGRALIREFLQNSVDAGSTVVMFGFDKEKRTLFCYDDGCGMDEDTLFNKLLVASRSGKVSEDTVGGFGKAKELLYFSWPEWEISTTCGRVTGSAYRYNFDPRSRRDQGTVSKITFPDNVDISGLDEIAKGYLATCETEAKVVWNGETIKGLRKGVPTVHLEELGQLYVERDADQTLYVRVKGVTMFSKYLYNSKSTVVLELEGNTLEKLTANRDGLRNGYQRKFDTWLYDFAREEQKYTRPSSNISVIQGGGAANNAIFRQDKEMERAFIEIAKSIRELPESTLFALHNLSLTSPTKEELREKLEMDQQALCVIRGISYDKGINRDVVVNALISTLSDETLKENFMRYLQRPFGRDHSYASLKSHMESFTKNQILRSEIPDIILHHYGNKAPINIDNAKYLKLHIFWTKLIGKLLSYQGIYGTYYTGFTFLSDYEYMSDKKAFLINPTSVKSQILKGMNIRDKFRCIMELSTLGVSCISEMSYSRTTEILNVAEDFEWFEEILDRISRMGKDEIYNLM